MIPVKRLVIEIENSLRISVTRNQRDPASNLPVGKPPGFVGIIERGNSFEGMTTVGDRPFVLTPIKAVYVGEPRRASPRDSRPRLHSSDGRLIESESLHGGLNDGTICCFIPVIDNSVRCHDIQ